MAGGGGAFMGGGGGGSRGGSSYGGVVGARFNRPQRGRRAPAAPSGGGVPPLLARPTGQPPTGQPGSGQMGPPAPQRASNRQAHREEYATGCDEGCGACAHGVWWFEAIDATIDAWRDGPRGWLAGVAADYTRFQLSGRGAMAITYGVSDKAIQAKMLELQSQRDAFRRAGPEFAPVGDVDVPPQPPPPPQPVEPQPLSSRRFGSVPVGDLSGWPPRYVRMMSLDPPGEGISDEEREARLLDRQAEILEQKSRSILSLEGNTRFGSPSALQPGIPNVPSSPPNVLASPPRYAPLVIQGQTITPGGPLQRPEGGWPLGPIRQEPDRRVEKMRLPGSPPEPWR
jgi:hypothetical protein